VLLCVIVPPFIDSSDLELNPKVIRGKSITLHCPVQGTPFPNVTWLKNDQVLSENEAVQDENEAGGRLRLRMSGRQLDLSLAQQSDAGQYSCVAVNVAGKAALHFNLGVLGWSLVSHHSRRRRGWARGARAPPPKIREKYFSGNHYVKFGLFSGKNHAKSGNFVNFSGKYQKIRVFR